ncbi:MAG: hypothetical protein ACI9W2_004090, partial [Gammaproteobacteria bacterium]
MNASGVMSSASAHAPARMSSAIFSAVINVGKLVFAQGTT